MSNNWIWAGGFLALALGGIGFGAKAGVEAGRKAATVDRVTDFDVAPRAAEELHPAEASAEAQAVRADARRDVKMNTLAEARAETAPAKAEAKQLPARVEMAPAKAVPPRVELKPLPAANSGITPAAEIENASAAVRIDRVDEMQRDVEKSTEEAPEVVESAAIDEPTEDAQAEATTPKEVEGIEELGDETNADTHPYAGYVVEVSNFGLGHARI